MNEILLKVALNTITITLPRYTLYCILTTLPCLVVTAGGFSDIFIPSDVKMA